MVSVALINDKLLAMLVEFAGSKTSKIINVSPRVVPVALIINK